VTNTQSNDSDKAQVSSAQSGLSWTAMLGIMALAILVAAAIAYLLVDPFFHHQPR
jgi:hypothetical protein